MHKLFLLTIVDRCNFDSHVYHAVFTSQDEARAFNYDYCRQALRLAAEQAGESEDDVLFDPQGSVVPVPFGDNSHMPIPGTR